MAAVATPLRVRNEAGELHPGADDNASGVAAVLEAARALSETDHRRPVALALWSGEELGVLGFSDFVERGLLPPARITAYGARVHRYSPGVRERG